MSAFAVGLGRRAALACSLPTIPISCRGLALALGAGALPASADRLESLSGDGARIAAPVTG